MADQIPKTKSKAQVLKMNHPRICLKTLTVCLCVLVASICSVLTATCPSSVTSSATITSEQCSYTGYTYAQTYGVAVGPVSSSFYYLYALNTPSTGTAVRKIDASGSLAWMASFSFYPTMKSLSVDVVEQSVYLSSWTNPPIVVRLTASTGSIVSQHQL